MSNDPCDPSDNCENYIFKSKAPRNGPKGKHCFFPQIPILFLKFLNYIHLLSVTFPPFDLNARILEPNECSKPFNK